MWTKSSTWIWLGRVGQLSLTTGVFAYLLLDGYWIFGTVVGGYALMQLFEVIGSIKKIGDELSGNGG